MDVLIIVSAVAWWTFAVVVLMIIANSSDIADAKSLAFAIGFAVFWPLTAVIVVPALIYQALVAGTTRIRADLKNRGILREFEDWLKTRNQ
jgi:hypothetical protein